MTLPAGSFVVGIDNGAKSNNRLFRGSAGSSSIRWSSPRVGSKRAPGSPGCAAGIVRILALTGSSVRVRAIGLDSPGPASAEGVIFRRGSTNFGHPSWNGFDLRAHLERRLGLPVVYNNDGNAAALYAHARHFGVHGRSRSSVSAIVGTDSAVASCIGVVSSRGPRARQVNLVTCTFRWRGSWSLISPFRDAIVSSWEMPRASRH